MMIPPWSLRLQPRLASEVLGIWKKGTLPQRPAAASGYGDVLAGAGRVCIELAPEGAESGVEHKPG